MKFQEAKPSEICHPIHYECDLSQITHQNMLSHVNLVAEYSQQVYMIRIMKNEQKVILNGMLI